LGTDTRLQLLGGDDFNYQPYLENLARELGVLSILHFLGVQNPFPYYAAAHVVLMCSRSEAFGRVTVEAMKMGRPVVGANAGATPELICDGHTGLLYRQGDPRDLADKLVQLHDDPVRRKTLGKAAQQWACNQFNSAKYGEDLSQVLREALDASRATQERSSFDTR
jgi:glycosyltransferase involved in cell wall biosynthesis